MTPKEDNQQTDRSSKDDLLALDQLEQLISLYSNIITAHVLTSVFLWTADIGEFPDAIEIPRQTLTALAPECLDLNPLISDGPPCFTPPFELQDDDEIVAFAFFWKTAKEQGCSISGAEVPANAKLVSMRVRLFDWIAEAFLAATLIRIEALIARLSTVLPWTAPPLFRGIRSLEGCKDYCLSGALDDEDFRSQARSHADKCIDIIDAVRRDIQAIGPKWSIPLRIGKAADMLGFEGGNSATKKLNRFIKEHPEDVERIKDLKGYYRFNTNAILFRNLPTKK